MVVADHLEEDASRRIDVVALQYSSLQVEVAVDSPAVAEDLVASEEEAAEAEALAVDSRLTLT